MTEEPGMHGLPRQKQRYRRWIRGEIRGLVLVRASFWGSSQRVVFYLSVKDKRDWTGIPLLIQGAFLNSAKGNPCVRGFRITVH